MSDAKIPLKYTYQGPMKICMHFNVKLKENIPIYITIKLDGKHLLYVNV